MSRERFVLEFDRFPLYWDRSSKMSTTSIRPELFFVLTYPLDRDGQPARRPRIVTCYGTLQTARKEIRDREVLRQYVGQSFIIRALPGVTDVRTAEVMS